MRLLTGWETAETVVVPHDLVAVACQPGARDSPLRWRGFLDVVVVAAAPLPSLVLVDSEFYDLDVQLACDALSALQTAGKCAVFSSEASDDLVRGGWSAVSCLRATVCSVFAERKGTLEGVWLGVSDVEGRL